MNWISFFRQWYLVIFALINLLILLFFHFGLRRWIRRKRYRFGYFLLLVLFSGTFIIFFVHFSQLKRISFYQLMAATFAYAAFLFITLSEICMAGFSSYLTKKRGENWTKEIDYFYLGIGALGLALSTNWLETVDHKMMVPDFVGPFVLATALVLRAIKTRAEVGLWNKPKIPSPV